MVSVSDPFNPPDDDMDFEPVGRSATAKRGKAPPPADDDGPGEGAGLDLALAYQSCNDFGNANRLIQRFGDDLVHVDNNGWFAWDNTRWDREGGPSSAAKMAHRVALAIKDEAKALKESHARNAEERSSRLYGWALQSGNAAKASSMLETAKPYLRKRLADFDTNDLIVAAPNCTIELKSLVETRRNDRRDYVTRVLRVPFIEGAECPTWHWFLNRVQPDEDMREFLQRIAGYCLTGLTVEQCLFIFYGIGRNGKSTFVNVLAHILGDYALNTPVQTFLAKQGGSGGEASPDIARLPGVRFLTVSEVPENGRLDESVVKGLTSNDTVTARHLNQGFFEFKPNFKVIMPTNHYPTIRGTDLGIWRRIRLVPWTVSIPEEEVDKKLEAKLLAEAPGILQWMLTGLEDWLQRGLDPPEKAKAAVEEYRAAMDPVGEFLGACCGCSDGPNPSTGKAYETSAKDLYAAYKAWCEREALEPLPGKTFGMKLAGKGINKRKTNGQNLYVGIYVARETLDL
jgi:putative DNA primase/helicase